MFFKGEVVSWCNENGLLAAASKLMLFLSKGALIIK